jgi:predicted PurR-regulated permease PerM
MSEPTKLAVWRVVEAAAALLVLGFFLFSLRGVLNPFLLFFLVWAVLVPFRGKPGHSELMVTATVLTLIWLLDALGTVLAPFVLAVVLAYVLDPVVDALEGVRIRRLRLARPVAIVLLTIPVVAVLALLVVVGIPAAVRQLGDVVDQAPLFFRRVADWVEGARERLLRVDLPLLDEEALVERLRSVDADAIVTFLQERREALVTWLWDSVVGVGRGLGTILGVLGYVVLTPVLTFYLLRDWDRLLGAISGLIPRPRREAVLGFARDYDHLLGRYLRGQVLVALSIGGITAAGLAVASFPYAAMLGLIVAIFSVVPYLGLLLSLAPALFIALVSGNVGLALLKVVVVYGIAQGLEGAVISPRIVGESVGLHPVWVVFALALGGFFFGFVGLLVAVPAAVGIKLIVQRGVARYRTSELYLGETPAGS